MTTTVPQLDGAEQTASDAIRPFKVNVSDAALADLRRRIAALIMTHGWPGSVIELLETVGPLTDPTLHGGTPGGWPS